MGAALQNLLCCWLLFVVQPRLVGAIFVGNDKSNGGNIKKSILPSLCFVNLANDESSILPVAPQVGLARPEVRIR